MDNYYSFQLYYIRVGGTRRRIPLKRRGRGTKVRKIKRRNRRCMRKGSWYGRINLFKGENKLINLLSTLGIVK